MKAIKFSLVTLALLGLAACGSGGGGSTTKGNTANNSDKANQLLPNIEKDQLPKELEQRIQKEKATSSYLISVEDEMAKDNKFIMFGKDFGTNLLPLDLFPRYKLVQENWSNSATVGNMQVQDKGFWRVYNQLYSGVVGHTVYESMENGKIMTNPPENSYDILSVVGINTEESQLPKSNTYTYQGIAFDMKEKGNLVYSVDFGAKEGSGKITGLSNYGVITLEKGKIGAIFNEDKEMNERFKDNHIGISGNASSQKALENDLVQGYELQFFGPNAEEIGGFVKSKNKRYLNDPSDAPIGFGGKR